MERFSFILVCWVTMCLLVHSHGRPTENLWTLYFRPTGRVSMCLRVRPTGDIVGTPRTPTLFNLLKEKVYWDRSLSDSNSSSIKTRSKFSLEAIATGKLICMNRTGEFYTLPIDAKWRRQERKRIRRFGRTDRKILPPEDCLFQSIAFSSNHSYSKAVGIYSAAHSNATIGRFISLTENGTLRTYRKSFDEFHKNVRIRVTLNKIKYLDDILNNTIFGNTTEFNKRTRNCIKNQGFELHNLRHRPLKKIIQKCRKRAQRKLKEAENKGKDKRGKLNARRSMKQDSRQRNPHSTFAYDQ